MAAGVSSRWLLPAGPIAAVAVAAVLTETGMPFAPSAVAGITLWCAVWWIFEVVPLPVTALVPFAAFPLTGVLTHTEVASAYGHTLVLLMLAGSIISKSMEKSGAHRRVAVGMVRLFGGLGQRGLVLGFLLASGILSMWISNTATVVMLLPVALAALETTPNREKLLVPLLLAVAYGAAVGGSATPVGTPPNLIFIENYSAATGIEVAFLDWVRMGLPVVALMLPIVWLWLCRRVSAAEDRSTLPELGPWQPDQKRVLIVLGLTALAWLTRGAPFGGWSAALGVEATAGDSTVALLAVVVLFMLPTGRGDGERLLDWERAVSIPWGVFIMIGGGMAIGMAFRESNLSEAMGTALAPVAAIPLLPMMLLLSLFATFFTEFTSNTAVANILMPIMAAVGAAAAIDPLLIMVPVTLATNFAFMLPVATAPNAIIYGAGEISMRRMMQEGFALNLIGAVVISLMCFLIL